MRHQLLRVYGSELVRVRVRVRVKG